MKKVEFVQGDYSSKEVQRRTNNTLRTMVKTGCEILDVQYRMSDRYHSVMIYYEAPDETNYPDEVG